MLQVLAAEGPLRYSDLPRSLSLLDQGVVHAKSLSAALPYLRETGLIRYVDRDGVYALTDFGAGLLRRLRAVEAYLGFPPHAGEGRAR